MRLSLFLTILYAGTSFTAGWGQTALGPVLGEPAPPIVASKWVRGEPVEQYKAGQVYVVDLWATWCKPCIASMPALHELESKYSEGLTVVAMNVWEMAPQGIPKFMESFGNTMPACVAMDSIPRGKEAMEGLTAMAFIGTSENISIPKSFLLDQQGRVVWIGHPDALEEPLSQVLAGTWNWALEKEKAESEAASDGLSADD